MNTARNSLPPGCRLHWYRIEKILGQGGFGITYLAEDTNLDRLVAIKEYLPAEAVVRESDSSVQPVSAARGQQFQKGLERFITEAKTLAQFQHPNIMRVLAVFRENGTAYLVMDYEHGRGLHEILKRERTLPESRLVAILMPLLDGLEAVHAAGFIHRDIKPANIYIRDDGSPVLLDFGSARPSSVPHSRSLTAMVSPGFAPFEQYTGRGDQQGPWTDIYGLGGTLYKAATGRAPVNAMDRSEALLRTGKDLYVPAIEINPPGYSQAMLRAIDRALAFRREDRPQSIAAWRDSLVPAMPAKTTTRGEDQAGEEETVVFPEAEAQTITVHAMTAVQAMKPSNGAAWLHIGNRLLEIAVATIVIISVLAAACVVLHQRLDRSPSRGPVSR